MNVKIEDNNLVITIPLTKPEPSKSGKALLVASTGGFVKTDLKIDDKVVSISLNACIPPK